MTPPYVPSENQTDLRPVTTSAGMGVGQVIVSASKETTKPSKQEVDDEEIRREAMENFRLVTSYEGPWRLRAREELNFVDKLEHWSESERKERKGRPCLTFDRIGPSVDQVVNSARQNPPEPRFSPVGGGADRATADILQGLLRNCEADSSAQVSYMTGYEHACKIGRGWWRLHFEFENDDPIPNEESFYQKIVFRRVANPFSIYPDPAAEEFDYSDMRWCFATEDLDLKTYKELYPDSRVAGMSDFSGVGDAVATWFVDQAVRVAEYWRIETSDEQTLLWLDDGRSVTLEQCPEGAQVRGRRVVRQRRVVCYKLNGLEILERTEWPGRWIPLVPCLGREVIIDGKRALRGMVRPAMDANLSYDYMRSKQVEAVGLAPIAPWLVAEGQIEGYENRWVDANRKAYPYLEYKLYDANGRSLPPPTRNMGEPAIQAITVATQFADNDIKATTQTWDASLGRPGPEFSGKAILAQQAKGDDAHFNYLDNLQRSMQHTGRVFLDLTPHVYSESRAISIFDPDGSIRQIRINDHYVEKGVEQLYKLGSKWIGRYAVTIGSAPSYASRRQQGANALMELSRTMPGPMTRAIDLVVKALDIPDADQLADRLRPPDIQADQDGAPPVPVAVQQQMAQQQQMIQALTEQVNQLHGIVSGKQVESDSKERQVAFSGIVELIKADLKAGTDHAIAMMEQQMTAVRSEIAAMRQAQGQAQNPPASPAPDQAAPGAAPEPATAQAETGAEPPAGAEPPSDIHAAPPPQAE